MLRGVIGSTIPFEGICFGSTPNEAVRDCGETGETQRI